MKIFTYGIDRNFFECISSYIKDADIVDVSEQYQDILALNSDIVIISLRNCSQEILEIIREFEDETKDLDSTIYIYLGTEEEMQFMEACYDYFLRRKRLWYLQWILTEH